MLTPEQLRDIPEEMVQIYIDLEDEIIADIARRISKAGVITETAEYQIDILKDRKKFDREYIAKYVKDNHSQDVLTQELIDVYEQALNL